MAGNHPRAWARPPDEIYLGGACESAHHIPELLEAVLPQVPSVPRGDYHGPRVRGGRTGGSRVRPRADLAGRDPDPRGPQGPPCFPRAWLQPTALPPGRRGAEKPPPARLVPPG